MSSRTSRELLSVARVSIWSITPKTRSQSIAAIHRCWQEQVLAWSALVGQGALERSQDHLAQGGGRVVERSIFTDLLDE